MNIVIKFSLGLEYRVQEETGGKIPTYYAAGTDTSGVPTQLLFGGYVNEEQMSKPIYRAPKTTV